MTRLLRLFAALFISLTLTTSCAALPAVVTVADTLWNLAKALCLRAHAQSVGVSPAEIAETACQTQQEIEPFVEPAKQALQAGATNAGLSLPPDAPAE